MTKFRVTLMSGLVACAALGGFASEAQAVIVNGSSSAVTLINTVTAATTGYSSDLIGKITLSNFSFATTSFSMTVKIENLTNAALISSGRLTAFGFNTTPDAAGVSDTSSVFSTFFQSNFPGIGTVDICAGTGPTCAGGGGGDLAPGATNTFTMTLTGLPTGISSIDLGAASAGAPELFDFKWQTGRGSFESQCTYGTSCGSSAPIPEPASMALLGFGLVALGAAARRRRGR